MINKRLSKELIEELTQRRKKGDSYSRLSLEFKIPATTILYHLNEKYRNRIKKERREYEKKKYKTKVFTPEQKAKRNERSKKYFKEKYNNDLEFRNKHINRVKEYNEKRKNG